MPKKTVDTSADFVKAMGQFYAASLRDPSKLFAAYGDMIQATMASFYGASDMAPAKGDKRFADPIWASNPAFRALMQSYLTWAAGLNDWVNDLDIDARDKMRAQILVSILTDSMAPTNCLMGNPSAMKKTLELGGKNLMAGAKHFIDDLIHNNGLPSMVDKSKFQVGDNLGISDGQVVYREDMLELIQYCPKTPKIYKRPIFIVPPQINKFYIWDLAPNRSVVEYLLDQGHQVFIVSWRNPSADHAAWGMDEYVACLDRATLVACDISKSNDLNMIGACSGGITTALLLSYWAAKGIVRANSMTLLVAVLDIEGAENTTMGLFANVETLELARMFTRSKGVLPGKDLQKAFAWLRPNDLIWSYWVNNYLMGNEPPAFDILYWNADTTNLPSKFHTDMLNMLQSGGARSDVGIRVLDTDLNLAAVTCDKFVVGGTTDHITPWQGCYQSMQSFGGHSEFVLSQSGHIQAIVNPPGNPKSKFMTNTGQHSNSDEFIAGAQDHQGTWWDYWATWLRERAGSQVAAPKTLGNKTYQPLCASPGTYVHETV